MEPTLRIARAEPIPENLKAIVGLIEEARQWLPRKGTDQWQRPWPDQEARNARIRRGLEVGATWIVWVRNRAAATVTVAKTPNRDIWRDADCNVGEPAVYAHRLIVDRQFAGLGLGAQLIDWTGLYGQRDWEAKWIRIGVWSTNKALHEYYMKRGFEPCGHAPDPEYPLGALFQKPVSKVPLMFTEPSAPPRSAPLMLPAPARSRR